MDLGERWHATWLLLDRPEPGGLLEALLAAYGEPHRAYHTTEHLAECFGWLDGCPVRPENPASVELALWFHDAVYDTRASDNEARSAAWAASALSGLPRSTVDRVRDLVLATQHTASPDPGDAALLVDVDLSILGAPRERFDRYELQIRREYGWVPEAAYRDGRARILRQLSERSRIYGTDYFRDLLEERARENLRRSLRELAG